MSFCISESQRFPGVSLQFLIISSLESKETIVVRTHKTYEMGCMCSLRVVTGRFHDAVEPRYIQFLSLIKRFCVDFALEPSEVVFTMFGCVYFLNFHSEDFGKLTFFRLR